MTARRAAAIALGCALSLALLIWVFARLDWPVFWAALAEARPAWIGWAGLALLLTIVIRAARWRLLAGLDGARLRDFFRAASIGYLGNYLYPLRAGEVMRVFALRQLVPGAALARGFATAAVDRAFDLVGVGVFLALVLRAHGVEALGVNAVRAAAGLVAFAAVAIAVFVFTVRLWRPAVDALARRLPPGGARRLRHAYAQAQEAAGASSPGRLALAFVVSLAASVVDYLAIWALLSAFDWRLPVLAAVTLGVFVQIGGALPSAPGAVGVMQVACLLALGLYGVADAPAVAFSVLYQLRLLTVIAAVGLGSALTAGLSLRARGAA